MRLVGSCPPTTAWADPITLSSALDAVIDNAVKFTPEDESVEVTVASNGETSTVVVADHGPGLTEEELARVGTASGAAATTRTSRAPASACPSPRSCWPRAAAPSHTPTTSRTASR